MKRAISPEALLLVLIALIVVLPLALGGVFVFQKHQWAQNQLAALEPRHARLQGLQESAQNLANAEAQAGGYDADGAVPLPVSRQYP